MPTFSNSCTTCALAADLAQALVEPDRLGHLLAHREQRVERGHRVLEDHRDALTADLLELLLRAADQLRTLQAHRALHLTRGHRDEPDDRAGGDRLARPRLAHEAHDLAGARWSGRCPARR